MTKITQGVITSLTTVGLYNISASVADVAGLVSTNTVIPEHLRAINILTVGKKVAYMVFDDNTSLIIGRLDGVETAPTE